MQNITLLFTYITHDILEPISYLPWGLCAGFLYILFIRLWRHFRYTKSDSTTLQHDIIHFFLIVYFITLLKLAFFSREPGSRTTINMQLWNTWGTTMQAHAFFIENILMFIPFGILVPLTFRKLSRILHCTATAFLCSLLLETTQLITERGFCELDDIVTNTIGALIGYLLYKILLSFVRT